MTFPMRALFRTFEIELVVPSQLTQPGFRRSKCGDDPALEMFEVIAKIGRARQWCSLAQFPSRASSSCSACGGSCSAQKSRISSTWLGESFAIPGMKLLCRLPIERTSVRPLATCGFLSVSTVIRRSITRFTCAAPAPGSMRSEMAINTSFCFASNNCGDQFASSALPAVVCSGRELQTGAASRDAPSLQAERPGWRPFPQNALQKPPAG